MPAKRKGESLKRRYYTWVLYRRDGFLYADGRSGNPVNLGRHSLESADRKKALEVLDELDALKAVEHGVAPGASCFPSRSSCRSQEDGGSISNM